MNKEEFKKELKELSITLTEQILSDLEEYYELLKEENKKYNLTRIIEREDVYLKHFYDCLTITKITNITNQSICDLGSGAGFPGLVLAICFKNAKLTLIESNSKKCNFLNIVKDKLSLNNVNIINKRVEEYAQNNREIYDVVTARAVAPLKHLLEYGVPLIKINGYFIAMKASIEEETKNIENYFTKLNIKEANKVIFNLPKEAGLRTLIKYQKLCKTNSNYPRRYSEIVKRDI